MKSMPLKLFKCFYFAGNASENIFLFPEEIKAFLISQGNKDMLISQGNKLKSWIIRLFKEEIKKDFCGVPYNRPSQQDSTNT